MATAPFVTPSQIAAAVSKLRFDANITAFEFQPSLGIVAKAVDRFALDISTFREPLRDSVKNVMIPSIRKNFNSGGRPQWAALAPRTVTNRGSAGPILIRSGRLRRGATSIGIWTITAAAATVKDLPDRIWYGKVHQAGAESSGLSGGKWLDTYKKAAKKALGPGATNKEITDLAFKMHDRRLLTQGAAPAGTAEIPARPFILYQVPEDYNKIEKVFMGWLTEKARRAGVFRIGAG